MAPGEQFDICQSRSRNVLLLQQLLLPAMSDLISGEFLHFLQQSAPSHRMRETINLDVRTFARC